ncbi:2-succinyl-6-hydroxy-2,4-cyclohexadiene-1-carboxylate synthase [Sporolactobacillus sp. THM7-7]|nr:2-succinyl-6-hydroxy-2,4-cyclohexadiene-1-carboxylate synthase [Sporolactobacillus sp. THM7-7]
MKSIIRGIGYHIRVKGNGEPVLLLHGFTGSLSTWRFLESRLGKHFRLIMIDLIGHGETDHPGDPRRYTMTETVNDLAELLNELHLEKVHVLGYSMGGRVALSFACLYPERVQSLILESSSPGISDAAARRARRIRDGRLAESIMERGIHDFVDRWEKLPLFASQKEMPQNKREALRKERLANHKQGLAESLLGMGTGSQPSWWDHLESLPMPVLLITGDRDEKFCRIAERMKNLLKDSQWTVVQSSGHAVHLEETDAFTHTVASFLTGQSARSEAAVTRRIRQS